MAAIAADSPDPDSSATSTPVDAEYAIDPYASSGFTGEGVA
jgi:hypothetical protein